MAADTAVLENTIAFALRDIDAKGVKAVVAEAGQGDAVLYCGASGDGLAGLLAADFRIFATDGGADFPGLSPAMKARRLAGLADALGLTAFSVCVCAADANAALHLAADEPEKLQRAILIEPQVYDANGVLFDPALAEKLGAIASHSLALFGTNDGGETQAFAAPYREHIPHCHLMYVYDAGDIVRERPQAAANVIGDFLRRGDGFLVSDQDGRLHP